MDRLKAVTLFSNDQWHLLIDVQYQLRAQISKPYCSPHTPTWIVMRVPVCVCVCVHATRLLEEMIIQL